MDHFPAAEGEEHDGQCCVVPDASASADHDGEPILQKLNRLAIRKQAENGPGETGRRLDRHRLLS